MVDRFLVNKQPNSDRRAFPELMRPAYGPSTARLVSIFMSQAFFCWWETREAPKGNENCGGVLI